MLFTIKKALEVRNNYKDKLIGHPMTIGSSGNIDGIFICRQGELQSAIDGLMAHNFDEKYPLIPAKDEDGAVFEIYVYWYDGANLYYHELDKNLTARGMAKTY